MNAELVYALTKELARLQERLAAAEDELRRMKQPRPAPEWKPEPGTDGQLMYMWTGGGNFVQVTTSDEEANNAD